jgi:protein ImuB
MFAVIYLPQFALQAVLRHAPEGWSKPVALLDPAVRPPIIAECTEPARAAGITPGLSPTQAMARCSDVRIQPRSSAQEKAAGHALLQCAYAFSPHLEATAPGWCTLDLRGLAALGDKEPSCQAEGNEESRAALQRFEVWAGRLQNALGRVRLAASIGVGATPNLARQAARWGRGIEVVENPRAFLSGLPVAALEPSTDGAILLQRWGIRTVGELLGLGQDALSARLGLEALALFAAASSTAMRPLQLVHPSTRFEEAFEFEPEVETLEPLLFLLRRFVDQLSQRLAPCGFVAETLVLNLALESGNKVTARLRLPQPTREPDVLFRTLRTYLETLRTESPVKSVALTVLPTQAEQKQLGLFETVLSDPRQFQETLARLAVVLGPERVGTPALENSHRPDTFRLSAPDFENAPVPTESEWGLSLELNPIRRFRPPLQAEVECEVAERPLSIRCAMSKGRLKIVVGPWRASGQWWEAGGWEREEWEALTHDGQVLRLVHQPEGWFVEGMMD